MVCQSVLNNFMYNSLSNELLEKMDERRRIMIENELTQLISRRDEVSLYRMSCLYLQANRKWKD